MNHIIRRSVLIGLSSLFSLTSASAADLIHQFNLSGNFADSVGTGTLTSFNTNTSTFVPSGWSWTANSNPGGGLILGAGLADPANYSLGFRVSYNEVAPSYRKLVSFRGSGDDNGLYYYNSNLEFYPFGSNTSITFMPDAFYDFVFARTSDGGGSINVYVVQPDGTLTKVYETTDAGGDSIPIALGGGKYEFRMFMDDSATLGEWTTGGTVSIIKVWNGLLTASLISQALSSGSMPTILSVVSSRSQTATAAAAALDQITGDSSNPVTVTFQPVLLGTDEQVSNAVTQTLPLLIGGSQLATAAALIGMNKVVQARIESNRGLNSGDHFYGDRNLWMKPFGSWADQHDRKGVSGYYAKTGGIAFGTDAVVSEHTRVGLAFAYAKADIDGNSSAAPSSANADVYQLIGYGSHLLDSNTEITFQIGYGQNKNTGQRDLLAFGLRAQAKYDSHFSTATAGLGRSYALSHQTSFTPSIRADYAWIKDKGYTETGAGALNLNVKDRSTEQLILAMDGKISHALSSLTTVNANLGLGYDFLNSGASITAAYAGAPGVAFTTRGLELSPWLVRGGLGIVRSTQGGMEISARYDAEYRQSFLNQTAAVKLRWRF